MKYIILQYIAPVGRRNRSLHRRLYRRWIDEDTGEMWQAWLVMKWQHRPFARARVEEIQMRKLRYVMKLLKFQ